MGLSESLEGFALYEQALFFLGILLFLISLVLLILFVVQKRPLKNLAFLMVVAILMIGFPAVKKVSVGDISIELNQLTAQVEANPGDSAAVEKLSSLVAVAESRSLSSPRVLNAVAQANAALGDTVKALQAVEKSLEADSGNKQALSLIPVFDKPRIRAEALIRRLEEDPDDKRVQEKLGEELAALQRLPDTTATTAGTLRRGFAAIIDPTMAQMYVDTSSLRAYMNVVNRADTSAVQDSM